jgi:hypothetical protein
MYSFLLKKALPFTLTFVYGAALGGLVGLFGHSEKKAESWSFTRTYEFGSRCRSMRPRNLVAETKPLQIIFKPVVGYSAWRDLMGEDATSARVNVTFGADGKIKDVVPLTFRSNGRDESLVRMKAMREAVESAARGIEFTPETANGLPVTVTREVEMSFARDEN